MPQKLNERELAEFGITTNHERMENGEVRFRLTGRDGSSYIRCENTGGPVWENSHSHSALREMVIVQEGCVVFAEYREGTARLAGAPARRLGGSPSPRAPQRMPRARDRRAHGQIRGLLPSRLDRQSRARRAHQAALLRGGARNRPENENGRLTCRSGVRF